MMSAPLFMRSWSREDVCISSATPRFEFQREFVLDNNTISKGIHKKKACETICSMCLVDFLGTVKTVPYILIGIHRL